MCATAFMESFLNGEMVRVGGKIKYLHEANAEPMLGMRKQ